MHSPRVIIFTKYSKSAPSSRYRYYNYVNCYRKHSIDVCINPFFTTNYLSTNGKLTKIILVILAYLNRLFHFLKLIILPTKHKMVIIEYELFPYFPSIFERVLKFKKIPYIVDYDDAIFHRYDQNRNALVRFLFKNKIAKVMKYANAVIVGNDYLQSYAQKYNTNILQLPTVVLLDKYKEALLNHKEKPKGSPFVIGWIGSKTTSPYVLEVLPAIEKFVSLHHVEFHLIGFDQSLIDDETQKKCHIHYIPWSEDTEIPSLFDIDVGIMPLRDDPWSKGKCGFKLIQYMSCKKPVIASPVGVNNSIIENGINGFLAKTNEQWFEALEEIFNDEKLRKSMAKNNWEKILKEYNHAKNCEKYVGLINDIVGKSKV